ncbi:MAG TPA: hypothetical protein VGM03_09050 [Phycisphaerae bacterium]
MTRHTIRPGLTLIELLVCGVILVCALGFAWYHLTARRGCGGPSPRLMCLSNLKGIGTSCKIYANDFGNAWPVPAFDESAIGMIDYTVKAGSGQGSVRSPDRTLPSRGGPGGARQLSVTRAFWMLVRSGDVTARQFICPNSGDRADPTEKINENYDFTAPENVSYGLQVPFGPQRTRAGEWMDARVALIADRGPYRDGRVAVLPPNLAMPKPRDNPMVWRPFNSQNHGGEGQNVLFADGHGEFAMRPIAGADHDNIYTVALDNTQFPSFMGGESPWVRSAPPYAPFTADGEPLASTDSVIFP